MKCITSKFREFCGVLRFFFRLIQSLKFYCWTRGLVTQFKKVFLCNILIANTECFFISFEIWKIYNDHLKILQEILGISVLTHPHKNTKGKKKGLWLHPFLTSTSRNVGTAVEVFEKNIKRVFEVLKTDLLQWNQWSMFLSHNSRFDFRDWWSMSQVKLAVSSANSKLRSISVPWQTRLRGRSFT